MNFEFNEMEPFESDQIDNNVAHSSVVLNSEEFTTYELNKLKGDSVGDTAYSGKWIINTLISLSKVYEVGWSQALESDLCMLWDMTIEKDIVLYLLNNEFLRMAEFTLRISDKARLTEIILGIIGNMCCQETALEAVGNNQELTSAILNLLTSDDPESLIQILRLLQAAVWNISKNNESMWLVNLRECEFFGHTVIFMLKNSTNDNLLTAAIDLLHCISGIKFPDGTGLFEELIKIDELVPALIESFTQLIPQRENTHLSHHSQIEIKVIANWLEMLSYVIKSKLFSFENPNSEEDFVKIQEIFLKILLPFKYSYNLIPINDKIALCIHECADMILFFQYNGMDVIPELNCLIGVIIYNLRAVLEGHSQSEQYPDPDNIINNLLIYLDNYWIQILEMSNETQIFKILRHCEKSVVTNLIQFAKAYVKLSNEKRQQLIKIEDYFK